MIRPVFMLAVALSLCAWSVHAESISGIIDRCSKEQSHAEMSECLERDASSSNAALQAAEGASVDHMSERKEDSRDLARMHEAFTEASAAFRTYREKQCGAYAAMAAGGNGGHDIYAACVVDLNTGRLDQLKWALRNW
jgi:uncharacterized protein YecT (DUF1311 family)